MAGAASDTAMGVVVRLVRDKVCSTRPQHQVGINCNSPGLPLPRLRPQSSLSHRGQTGPLSADSKLSRWMSGGLTAPQILVCVPDWEHIAIRSQNLTHSGTCRNPLACVPAVAPLAFAGRMRSERGKRQRGLWAEHQGTRTLQTPNSRSWGLTRESFINCLPGRNKMEIRERQINKGGLFSSRKETF